ncbi:MAG: SUMF1/EgtB/PvdO family nonheme iron enzyme, partial [Pyrinomonadaceae bacterium]
HYMPPEQWDNENVDTRSDIYSIGIMLFQMLTGDVPFKGDSMPNIMYQHLQAPVPSFASLGISPTSSIESVIHKALEKEQDQRFATVEEFLSAYERALFNTNEQIAIGTNAKTVSFSDEAFQRFDVQPTEEWHKETDGKSYNLSYLDSAQNEKLATYFNHPKPTGDEINENLEREFINAQGRVEEARTKVSQAEKLAEAFNEAQKAAEDARRKFLEAQQKLEEDVRREMQAEMDSKLAVERKAREKAEAEAGRLAEEVKARQQAEERSNQLAKTALDAQQRAQAERGIAEREAKKRQLEEGTRRQAEEAASKLAHEAANAMRRYEEAKQQAEFETRCRVEAENKRRKIEEEISRIAASEAERRNLAEEQAAIKIREQTSRLEKQAVDAQEKADEARLLAETEARKRESAEEARRKAEEEARRLAEEIIAAQKRLEEAEQRARSEAEKRVLEDAARKKAEESARSSSLENQQNFESIQQNLMSQLAEAQMLAKTEAEKRALEEAARKRAEEAARALSESRRSGPSGEVIYRDSAPILAGETQPGIELLSSGQQLVNTSATAGWNTDQIALRKGRRPVFLIGGLLAFLAVTGVSVLLVSYALGPAASTGEAPPNNSATGETSQTPMPGLPARIKDKMVLIKGGEFLMGRDDVDPSDERIYGSQYPAHSVTVEDFYLDKTEVTNDEYVEFIAAKGVKPPDNWKNGSPPAGEKRFPVTGVSYFDAGNFAGWMSSKVGIPCRLPTEQEWEYAARSGTKQYIFPWGNEWIPSRVNFATGTLREVGTSADETAVGSIEDLMGNVLEWTSSTLEYYPNFPSGKKEPISGKITVRGVSYTKEGRESLQKTGLLLTLRQGVSPDRKFEFLGFRLSCNSKQST